VESKEEIIVGVNQYQEGNEKRIPTLKISPALEKKQVQRLKKFKKSRKDQIVARQLEIIRNAAGTKDNLMPLFISALESKVTLGEISHALRDVFGLHRENVVI